MVHQSANVDNDKRLEYLVNGKINKEIIIAGASRGSRGIIAGQIEDETGFSLYNLCYPGSDVEFHNFVVETLVKFNDPPKILLLVVDDDLEFTRNEKIVFRKDRLYPLVNYPYIRKELIERESKSKIISSFFVLYRMNISNFDIIQRKVTALDSIMECGSMPISYQREGRNWNYNSNAKVYSVVNEMPEKVSAFLNIIEVCHARNIKLVLVFPPSHNHVHSKSFEDRIRQLAGDSVSFYIYNTDNPIYKNREYYFDEDHLVKRAATIFTNDIILYLHDLVKELEINKKGSEISSINRAAN